MVSISASNFVEFDRFYYDAFGDAGELLDDISFSPSEDSYDSFTTNESYSCSSSSSGDEHSSKKKPKFHRNAQRPLAKNVDVLAVKDWEIQQAYITMPRLVKTDVRRSYTAIFQNVVNIQDFPLMFEFLNQYCTPSLIQTQPHCSEEDDKSNLPVMTTTGLRDVAQFWFNHMYILPDITYTLLDTKVHTYSHTQSSKIVSRFVMSGTRIFDLTFETVFPKPTVDQSVDDTSVASTNKGKKRSAASLSGLDIAVINRGILDIISKAALLATPEFCCNTVSLTMHLDSNKCIEKMEFEAEEWKKPVKY